MRLRTLLTATLSTVAILAAVPAPAQAGIPGLARGNVVFQDLLNPPGIRVCGSGAADDAPFIAGEFAFTLIAVRSDGSQFVDPAVYPGPSFLHCRSIYFDGTDYGSLDVVVSYGGAGLDLVTLAYGVAGWSPATGGSFWTSFGV